MEGYSTYTLWFTFIPISLGARNTQLLVKFENEKHSPELVLDVQ